MEKRSYSWFERRRRTEALNLAQNQITKALDTTALLHKAMQQYKEEKIIDALKSIENLFKAEEDVDGLRREIFREMSKDGAMYDESREDLLHLVKRLDTLADYVKDAARCLKMLADTKIPKELLEKTVYMTSMLMECAVTLRASFEKITEDAAAATSKAKEVEQIEHEVDTTYLETKPLFVKYAQQMNCGSMVIFDDMIEFIEQAADMCADTADYIVILAGRE
jgi:predicted phosphate transport protein (TIGR00153 family)